MERRMRRKSHVRCGARENLEIVSKDYLSLSSVECIERNLDPMTTPLIVMSRSDNTGSGLTLASSPTAKKKYHITNVSRATDLPYPLPKELHIVPPRMNLYIKKIWKLIRFLESMSQMKIY